MKQKLLLVFSVVLLSVPVLFSQTKFIPFQQLPNYNGSSTGSGIYFSASMTTSSITITFEGPADRWFGFGFGTAMHPADVFIYSQGHAMSVHPLGWYDYVNSSYSNSGVLVDASQDWNIVSTATTTGGTRTVTATRALNTGDANDVILSFTSTSLDMIWAKGASANYTIAYHGSTNRVNGISLPWLSTPTASFTVSSQTICQGSSVTFSNLSSGGQTSYTWNFSGASAVSSTSTNPIVTYTASGSHAVVLTASNVIGTNTLTQVNYITVTPTVVPSISINALTGSNPVCSGSTANFSASILNGGSSPSYQWKVNGVNTGPNNPNFSSTTLNNSDLITCALVSNQTCVNPNSANSSAITMTVHSSAASSVAIVQNTGSNPLCLGSVAGFSATPFNGGTTPVFQWKLNGLNVGLNSPTYTSNTLNNGDIINCYVTSNDLCTSSSIAVSSVITITVSSLLVPVLNISINPPGAILCSGANISFTTNPTNGGSAPSYQWYVNGISVGTNSASFSSNTLSHNDVVSCVLSSALSCASPVTASSSPITLSINPTPASPSISASGSATFCPNDSLILSSSSPLNNYWSNNATSQTIAVHSAGDYSLLVSSNSCSSAPVVFSAFVFPAVSASLDPVGPLCLGSDPVNLIGYPPGGSYSGPGVISHFFVPQSANLGNTNFIIYLSHQIFNNTTCADTASIRIIVNDCTGLENLSKTINTFTVYPNPSNAIFTISGENVRSLTVFELHGRQLYFSDKVLNQINLEAYPDGVYFLRIEGENKATYVRLIKQRQ